MSDLKTPPRPQGSLRGPDRSLLAVVPTPIRRLAGLWLLGLCLGLPAFVALFR